MSSKTIGTAVAALICLAAASPRVFSDEGARFTMPSESQLEALAQDPSAIVGFISNATEDQTADLIAAIIGVMVNSDMSETEIRRNVAQILSEINKTRGEAFASTVALKLRKKANPRLLPIIRGGGDLPPPPSPAPKYDRQ